MGRPEKPVEQIKTAAIRNQRKNREIAVITELPVWVKQALTRMHLEDLTIGQAARQFGRSPETLKSYIKSPAAKEWVEQIKVASNDPREFTRTSLEAATANVMMDLFYALELAKKAKDHNAIRLMSQWLLERPEMLGAVSKDTAPTIVINIPGGAGIEPIMIESSHEETPAVEADWDLVEEDK